MGRDARQERRVSQVFQPGGVWGTGSCSNNIQLERGKMHIEQTGEISARSCKTVVCCAKLENQEDTQKEGPGLDGGPAAGATRRWRRASGRPAGRVG